jgi:hypothetical protein
MALLSLTAVGALNTSRVMYVAESRPQVRHGGGPQVGAGKGSTPRTAAAGLTIRVSGSPGGCSG